LIRTGRPAGFNDLIAPRRNLARPACVSDTVSSSGNPSAGEYRTLEGVAVAVTILLAAHALSAELEPLWRAMRLLFGI